MLTKIKNFLSRIFSRSPAFPRKATPVSWPLRLLQSLITFLRSWWRLLIIAFAAFVILYYPLGGCLTQNIDTSVNPGLFSRQHALFPVRHNQSHGNHGLGLCPPALSRGHLISGRRFSAKRRQAAEISGQYLDVCPRQHTQTRTIIVQTIPQSPPAAAKLQCRRCRKTIDFFPQRPRP